MSQAAPAEQTLPAPSAPREVPLRRGALLLFAHAQGSYRLALYWISQDRGALAVVRSTGADPLLVDALRECFRETPFATEAPEVERYLRATRWGEGLP